MAGFGCAGGVLGLEPGAGWGGPLATDCGPCVGVEGWDDVFGADCWVCVEAVDGTFDLGAAGLFLAALRWIRRLVFPAAGDGFEAGAVVSAGFSAGVVAVPPVVVLVSEEVDG